jgi:transposase InsO family protein
LYPEADGESCPLFLSASGTTKAVNFGAWGSDITYIKTDEGWLYCAIVKDLCTRQIVGHACSAKIDTQLTIDALNMAIRREQLSKGLIHHSDLGIQYASNAYWEALAKNHIQCSMSRRGNPYDNAVSENFFSCMKCEALYICTFAHVLKPQQLYLCILKAFTTQDAYILLLGTFHRWNSSILSLPIALLRSCCAIGKEIGRNPLKIVDFTNFFLSVFSRTAHLLDPLRKNG